MEDLTMSCESWDSNAAFDVVPFPAQDDQLNPIALYLGERMEEYITHPYASPLFGDFKGLPPLLIQAGDAEVLRDEITLLAHKATLAGVEVQHELYEDAVRSGGFIWPLSHAKSLFRFMCSIHFLFSPRHVALSHLCGTSSETSFLKFAVVHRNF
jgi:acetyl esterase/lipase